MIIDLTFSVTDKSPHAPDCITKVSRKEIPLKSANTAYTGVVYDFSINSMGGTYIDFPGHIKETDNGEDAGNFPIKKLYRRDATVIQLEREDNSGGVSAEKLQAACSVSNIATPILIINALGKKRFDDIEKRSVYLTLDAVEWIISTGIEIIVSDIYESQTLEGVFLNFFKNNISTICCPINLHLIANGKCKLTILPLKMRGITQIPCRLICEVASPRDN